MRNELNGKMKRNELFYGQFLKRFIRINHV